MAVLDRAGIRPIDFDPNEGKDEGFDFNPRDYTPEELDAIEAALRLMVEAGREAASAASRLGR